MQPDLERLLRESRNALPEPDAASVRHATLLVLGRLERRARRRRLPLVATLGVGALLLLSLIAVAAERAVETQRAEAATLVVDRTLVCTTGVVRGLRGIEVQAGPRVVQAARPGSARGHPSIASVESGMGPDLASAGVSGRLQDGVGWQAVGLAWYTQARCRLVSSRLPGTTRARVPLTTSGLRGGALSEPRRHFCETTAPVIVRVRAAFVRPTSWRRWTSSTPQVLPGQMRAHGMIREGYVAVQSQAGNRPLAFAAITQTRARLFTAPRCWRG